MPLTSVSGVRLIRAFFGSYTSDVLLTLMIGMQIV
jgi:hypothetical protein